MVSGRVYIFVAEYAFLAMGLAEGRIRQANAAAGNRGSRKFGY